MLTLIAAVIVAVVGSLIFWSNPARPENRVSFSCSLHLSAWLITLYLATASVGAVFWLRTACAISAWVPFHYWLVKENIAGTFRFSWSYLLGRAGGWIVSASVLVFICYSDSFIPAHSTPLVRIRGWGYYAYIILISCMYAYVFGNAYRALSRLTGVRRLELQVWLGGGCSMAVVILALMGLNAITHQRIYILLQPIVILGFYAGMIFAITTYRILDARQILLLVIEKSLLVSLCALVAFAVKLGMDFMLPGPFALLITTAVVLWFAAIIGGKLDRIFDFFPQAGTVRLAAFAVAQRETRLGNLEQAFSSILKGWGQTDRAIVLSGQKDLWIGSGIELSGDSPAGVALRQLRWVTPERIMRERLTPERDALGRFLSVHELGLVVIEDGPSLTLVVGVGVGASRRPYTFPQVTLLLELASIIENALERAHFSAKVQHAEQLATVGLLGASLAHEIRNPLVSIKTFVQLLPTHHHDPKFREKFFSLIGDEVARIDQLTQQLLDLAAPRTYETKLIELHPLLRSSLELVATKAVHRDIQFVTEFGASPDRAYTDASAAKQVMLNLCFNAIQAVELHQGRQRWVKISTRNTPNGIEMAVADSGSGISAEIRPKLFQPFQTTKSSGFGLGLAICSDILANLNATISVDPLQPGYGAVFRVTFPCQPLSS